MRIILDFDNTLFNDEAFIHTIRKGFYAHGVSEDAFNRTARVARTGELWQQFYHMELLSTECNVSFNRLEQSLNTLIADARLFLYADVVPFLQFANCQHMLYILTFGEDRFQRMKIYKTGLGRYFQSILVTQDVEKGADIARIADGLPAVFVDDNPRALEMAKVHAPQITTVRMRRGHGKYKDMPDGKFIDYEITNLDELRKII